MSAEYRTVNPQRLALPLQRGCSDLASLLYTHLLLGPLSLRFPGLVTQGPLALAESMSREDQVGEVRAALLELVTAGLAEFDAATRVIRLIGVLADHIRQTASADTLRGWVREACNAPRSPVVTAHLVELLGLRPSAGEDQRSRDGWIVVEKEVRERQGLAGNAGRPPEGAPSGAPARSAKPRKAPQGGGGGPSQGGLRLPSPTSDDDPRPLGGTPEGASEPNTVKDQDQDQDLDPERKQDQDQAPAGPPPALRIRFAPHASRILESLARLPHPPGKKPLRDTTRNREHLEALLAEGELPEDVLYVSARYLQILERRELVPQRKGPPRTEDPTWFDSFVWRPQRYQVVRSIVEACDNAVASKQAAEQEAALAAAAAGRERDRLAEAADRSAQVADAVQGALARGDSYAAITEALADSNSFLARNIVRHQKRTQETRSDDP